MISERPRDAAISTAMAKVFASIDPTRTRSSQRVRQAWAFWKHRLTSFAKASSDE